MNPIINHFWTPEERARHGIRSIEDFTTDELALLQEKLAGWMRQRAPHPGGTRHRTPFVMRRRTDAPASGMMPQGVERSSRRDTA
jgi:hypothetical protein